MIEIDWSIGFINFIWAVKEVVAMCVFLIAVGLWFIRKNWWSENFLAEIVALFALLWLTGTTGYLCLELGLTSHFPPSLLPFLDSEFVSHFLVCTLGASLPILVEAIFSHCKLYFSF